MGYAGRCAKMFLAPYAQALAASGAQSAYDYSAGVFVQLLGISAVFVEPLNVFEGQVHSNTDDWIDRFWDSGLKTAPFNALEGHDEGDTSSNAATSSWSGFGEYTFMSVEEAAQLLNTTVDEFTPAKFKQVYRDTWIKEHEFEAAEDNPNPGAEQEIIDEVKDEMESADETTSSAEPETAEDGGTNAAATIEEDSASGRKLASVAARFVSAALRVFGI